MILPKPIRRRVLAVLSACCLVPLPALCGSDPLHVDVGENNALELVEIAPGTFTQGSKVAEQGRHADETSREVTLTKKFFLGKYPVTRGQFARFVKESGYKTEAEGGVSGGFGWSGEGLVQRKEFTWRNPGFAQTDLHPVTIVTYKDAKAFLSWLSRKSGREFKLPTEAQWEYACRAGTTMAWPNGDDSAASDAVVWNKRSAGNGTRAVGLKPLNAWGLGDMPGNVFEWCEDWYAPYEAGPVSDPLQTNAKLSDKPRRVLRGGSWVRDPNECRSASRYRNDPGSRNADNGFRVMTFDAAATLQLENAAVQPKPAPTETESRPLTMPQRAAMVALAPQDSRPAPRIVQASVGTIGVVFVIVLVFVVIRGLMRSGGAAQRVFPGATGATGAMGGAGGRVFTRIADDGFWITGENVAIGAPLVCRYQAGAGEQEVQIAFEPGPQGQFVYTGQRPSNVTVVISNQVSSFGPPMMRNVAYPNAPLSSSAAAPMPTRPAPSPRNPPAY